MDVPVPGATNHLGHTNGPSGSSSSLLSKVKRQFSLSKKTSNSSSSSTTSLNSLREHLPKSLGGTSRGGGDGAASSVLGGSDVDEPTAYTIAPPDHRENTARHAMMDSLPSFGSLHPPQISLVNPLRGATGPSCFSPDYDSDDDASPPPTPPISAPSSRRPSLNAPPFPRRASDPSSPSKGAAAGSKSSSSSSSSDPLDALYGNVVQLGGFRGSILRDARTNKRLWIPLKVGFGIRKVDLGLGLEDDDEPSSEERIVPGHMLSQIGGWIDLGRKLKNEFKRVSAAQHAAPVRDPLRPPLRYHSFGYDWRRSLQMSSRLLLELLVRLKEESAARGEGPDGRGLGATIVAHSMGGLVALHALASAPDPTVVRGVLFAGSPFQGCINTLGAFKLGGGVAFNQKVGNPATVFSWRSGFYFLPRPLPDAERQQAEEELPDLPLAVGDPSIDSAGDRAPPSPPSSQPSPSSSPPSGSPSKLAPPPSQPPTPRRSLSYPTPAIPLHRLLSGCFETPRGEPIPVDFFDPQTWATYALNNVPAGMDFERPYLRPQTGSNGAGDGDDGMREHGSNPLSAFGAPGNLGERSSAFPGVDLAGNVEEAVERVTEQLGEAWAQENDADASEETMRLRRQAREVDTVRRYLARTLERAREFQDDLIRLYDPAKAHLYPPLAILTSHKTPTVRGVLVTSRDHIVSEGYERLLWAEGDGIVLHESAIRLPGDPEVEGRARTGRPEDDKWMVHLQGVVETTHGHVGLLGDLDGVRQGMQLLYG
ncbi:hypothetical protein JCM8208_007344 [Rhodotorula glutinis]